MTFKQGAKVARPTSLTAGLGKSRGSGRQKLNLYYLYRRLGATCFKNLALIREKRSNHCVAARFACFTS